MKIADIEILVREKYLSSSQSTAVTYGVKIGEYLQYQEWAKRHQLVCPEDYPRQVVDLVLHELTAEQGTPPAFDISARPEVGVHVAYPGSVTPLHFDWDMSEVLHLNLLGERTVWAGAPLSEPGLPVSGNSVLMDAEGLPVERRRSLLEWFGLKPHLLRAGEAVRFPAHYWHLIEYNSTSLAVSVRREVSPELRPLQCFGRSWQLQLWLDALLKLPRRDRERHVANLISAAIDIDTGSIDVMSPLAVSRMETLISGLSERVTAGSAWQPIVDLREPSSFVDYEGSTGTFAWDIEQMVRLWLFAAYEGNDIESDQMKQELLVRSYLARQRSK